MNPTVDYITIHGHVWHTVHLVLCHHACHSFIISRPQECDVEVHLILSPATNDSDWNKLETSIGPRIEFSTLSGLMKVASNVTLDNDLSLRKCSV